MVYRMKNIMIIEDERSIADTVIHCVERESYKAEWHNLGLPALESLKGGGHDLVVLDVGLPDISGFELCKRIRSFSSVPIIFLTARDDEIDKIVGLEIGGDDYVTKPFSPRELGARIKTVLRRYAPAERMDRMDRAEVPSEKLRIIHEKMQAVYHGKKLELTRYEYKLLVTLAASPGRVYSRDTLMRAVWGDDSPSFDRTVDAHIKSLRAKCREVDDSDPIVTHRGTGYALRDDL